VGDRFVEWSTQQFADEVQGGRQGPDGAGRREGRQGLHLLEHPDRVDRPGLCDLDGRWGHGPDLRDLLGGTGRVDRLGLRCGRADGRERGTQGGVRLGRPKLTTCKNVFVIDDGALESSSSRAPTSTTMRCESAPRRSWAATSRPSSTPRDHGRPKGCVISHYNFAWDATQVAARLPEFLKPGERTLLFLPLAHIFARVIQTSCIRSGVCSRSRPGSRTCSRNSRSSSRLPHRRSAGLREGLQRSAAEGRTVTGRARSSTRPLRSPRTTHGRARPARSARHQGSCTASSTSSSTASCATSWAVGSVSPCPVAQRSVSASATSTTASASRSSRATA
jgi:hypothetical protein